MSRYRKVEVRTWSDSKFRSLSPLPASGQSLWLYLITGTHTGPIPGLFRAGRAGMAEELGWDIEAFDKAFAEVSNEGMAIADFKARLVWLPNALRHNKPESPNVVRSWRAELSLLPECELKDQAIAYMREYLSSLGEGYAAAASEVFSEGDSDPSAPSMLPSPKASGKPSAKTMANQEQEQEQDKEQKPSGAEPPETLSLREVKIEEPPPAEPPSVPEPVPIRSKGCTFATFVAECRAKGEKPIPEDHPVFRFADDAGIPIEFIRLAWLEFRRDYGEGKGVRKRQAGIRGWRQHFDNSVRKCWYRLWAFDRQGECYLTPAGIALQREAEARDAA